MSNTKDRPCSQVGLNKLLCVRGQELQFRAWNRIVERMSEPFGIDHDHRDTAWQNIDIMQWSGFKDKNGKDVYEGDLISYWGGTCVPDDSGTMRFDSFPNQTFSRSEDKISVVEFSGVSFRVNRGNPLGSQNTGESEIVIIGNIYQNPELLLDT